MDTFLCLVDKSVGMIVVLLLYSLVQLLLYGCITIVTFNCSGCNMVVVYTASTLKIRTLLIVFAVMRKWYHKINDAKKKRSHPFQKHIRIET